MAHISPFDVLIVGDTIECSLPITDIIASDGIFNLVIDSISDAYGCTFRGSLGSFIYDVTPPVITLVSHSIDTIYSDDYDLRFTVSDLYTPISTDSLKIVINHEIYIDLLTAGVGFDGRNLHIRSTSFNDGFPESYPLSVCISGFSDMPSIGNPNVMRNRCFEFYVNGSAPSFHLVTPDTSLYYSCDTLFGEIEINHPAGIDSTSIVVYANGELIGGVASPYVAYLPPFLHLDLPLSPEWHDIVELDVSATTLIGDRVAHGSWIFRYDHISPDISCLETELVSSEQVFNLVFSDDRSGVDTSTFSVNVSTTSGMVLPVTPSVSASSTSFTIPFGFLRCSDTLVITAGISDRSGLCGANSVIENFFFPVPCSPPSVSFISSLPELICGGFLVFEYSIYDENGIYRDDILFDVSDSITILSTSSLFSFDDSIMRITIPVLDLDEGLNSFTLTGVKDSFFNESSLISHSVLIDYSSPIINLCEPSIGDTIRAASFTLTLSAFDSFSGIDPSSVVFTLDGSSLAHVIDSDTITVFVSGYSSDASDLVICSRMSDNCFKHHRHMYDFLSGYE